ncbi:MAG: Ig-like domain-containing protein, partial [Candidatus Latescibacterota bacterium]|nr:Ig-like domain-containing protein [Candidatus Latescibacterota bacterium]
LSYNVRIGTEPGEQDILSAEVPLGPGNAGLKSDYVLGSFLPPDTYFWSVQTVDGGLARSEFTAEGRFTVEQFVSSDQRLRSLSNSSMAWSDFDGDGDDDLALMGTNRSGEARTLLYANEEGTLSLHTDAGLLGLTKGDVAWADIDGDGDLDLFSGGQIADDNREGIIYRVSGEGLGSTFDPAISFSPALDFSSAQFGDLDLDGDLDLVYAGQSDSVENNQLVSLTTVWLNDGDGGYSQGFDGVEGVNNGDLELADLDGDGDLDLLLTGAATDGDPRTLLYRNDHPLDFIDTGAQIQALESSNLALGDVDRDGDLDLALGGLSASGLYAAMFTNDGGVLTQREDVALPGIIAGDFTWADYDNDQDLDLIVSGNNGATSLLQVFENTIGQAAPDSAFELLTLSNLSGVDFSAVSAADPDGDGDLDLISSGRAADFSPSSVVNDNLASQQFNSNVAPNAASTLVASDSADDVRLSWQPGSDDGAPPVASLSYNVRIGSESEGHDILSGARPLGRGNAGHNLFVDIEGLDSDTYFWSVQTIDAGGVASPWSTQSSFIVDTQSPSLTSLALNRSELGLGQTLTLNIGFADAHAGIDAAISPTVTATVADQGFEVLPLQFTGDTWTGELTITDGIPSGAATISVAGLTDLKGNVLVPVDSTSAFLVDADRPAVVASDPADGADSVTAESGASVTVTFSEPLDPATVLASNFAIRLGALSIASTATYVEAPDAITVALVPEGGLLPGNEYSVEAAAGIADLVGNVIGQSTTWSFRTQIPNLTETIPPASADSVDAAASVLSATFDTQVLNDGLLRSDAVRILREGVEVALRQTPVFDVPSLSLLFEPEGGLRPGSSYQVTLTGLLGGPLRLTGEGDYSWAFTTRLASPTEFSPARGDTGVPVTTSGIRVTFDAGIDPVVLASDDSAVQLFREGQLVDIGSPSYDPDARALSFGPTVGFLSGSTYRVVLDSELRGPQAAGEIDWSVRTQIPEVVSTTPTDAASITSDPRRISVTFSSPVDSAGRAPRNFRLARGGRPLVLAANEFLYDPATFTVSLPSVDLVSGSEYTVAVSGRIGGPQSALTDHLFTFRTEIPTVSSTEPADGDEGIGTSQGLISVDFSSPIANQSAEGFSLRSRSLDATDTTFVVLPITGFGADSTQTHINFAPEGGFRAFTEYEVIVDRRALGPLAEEGFSWRFSTAPRLTSISDGGTVSNADGSIQLYLPPNALSGSDGEIAISPVTADDGAGRPVASQQTQVGPAYRIDAGSATLRKPATLTIGYDTDDLAGANAARLGIFALADGDVWTRVGGTVDEAARTVTTTVPALGTFGVFEDTGAGLGSLAVADVDCQPRAFTPAGGQLRDRTDISFDLSAPADVTVRVYNVSGRVERVLSRDRAMAPGRNTIVWDGRDDDADVVASGLYVVVVSVAGAQAEKVVAVVH